MLTLSNNLEICLQRALERAFPLAAKEARLLGLPFDPQLVKASRPEFGDFQINCALSLAKKLKQSPRDIALAILDQLAKDKGFSSLCESPKIAGPGFINLTIKPHYLANEIQKRLQEKKLGDAFGFH